VRVSTQEVLWKAGYLPSFMSCPTPAYEAARCCTLPVVKADAECLCGVPRLAPLDHLANLSALRIHNRPRDAPNIGVAAA